MVIKTVLINDIIKEINEKDSLVTIKAVRIGAQAICVLFLLISLFFADVKTFAAGLFFGGAVAQLMFRQHELTVKKSVAVSNAKNITVINYFIRLLIRGIALVISILNPSISIVGCILGLLSISYAIYALAFIDYILHKKKGKEELDERIDTGSNGGL